MGIIKKGIIRAQINDLGLYSKAEDVAEKMRQKKGRGDDIERFFRKQGVKAEELEALGLTDLFRQERVTRQEILDRISQNRIEMEENVSTGPDIPERALDYYEDELTMEEAYGPDHLQNEAEYYLTDSPDLFLYDDFVIEDLARDLSADQAEMDQFQIDLKKYENFDLPFADLPEKIQEELRERAENYVIESYEDNPIRRVTLTSQPIDENITGQLVGDDIGELPGAAFSYSLVGNDEFGYGISGLETGVPPQIRRQIENANIFSVEEASVQLQSIAYDYEDFDFPEAREGARWGQYTLDEGENYQEARLSLPSKGKEKFREGVHFPDDINNVFHIRTKDRKGPLGTKILYVEEVQSDWAQTGRKKGFKSEKKVRAAEAAADQVIEEVRPLLEKLNEDENLAYPSGQNRNYGNNFAGSITSLADAARQIIGGNRSLDVVGEILTALETADNAAKRNARNVISEDFFEGRTTAQKAQDYVEYGEAYLPSFFSDLPARERRAMFEQEAVDLVRRADAGDQAAQSLLSNVERKLFAKKYGNLDAMLRELPGARETYNRMKAEQKSYLQSVGIDPNLYDKLRLSLDKADPEGAKLRAEKAQRGLAEEGPFVLDTDSWNKLAVKYIFKKAVEEGYDGVSFAPGKVHVDRWGDEGLRVQYDQNIPRAINSVLGLDSPKPERRPPYSLPYPTKIDDLQQYFAQLDAADKQRIDATAPSNRPDTMEVEGYESKVYFLDDLTKDGESIFEKMKAPSTMFGFAPLPLIAPQGIVGLQGLSSDEAEEQERKVREFERTFPDAPIKQSSGILGALRGAGEVGYEAISDLLIEPFLGMSAAEAAFEMGLTPEQAEAARRRAAQAVDFEVSSPTGLRYKETLKGGLGDLGEYLMREGSMGQTRSGMPIYGVRDPVQYLFQEAVVPASEAVTEGALGIIGLDPRDTEEMERVRKEAARPFIETVQPII